MKWWLYRKFIVPRKALSEPTTIFSLAGISLGVAFLIVSMAGFSGFTESLKKSIIDVSGDVSVLKRGSLIKNPEAVAQQMKQARPDIQEILPFAKLDTLVAHQGKLSAVLLQGVDWQQLQGQQELLSRRIQTIKKGQEGLGEPTYLGKVVAQKLNLKIGDSFKAILPQVSKTAATRVAPRVQSFFVHSILDFGKYVFNERVVLAPMPVVQELGGLGDRINGFRLRLKRSDEAAAAAESLQQELGWDYFVRDWSQNNSSLFQAIQYEKMVLFFVMLIMVVAAFFNVSTTLFLGVLRRYSQVSVMRALGLKKRDIVVLFCLSGFVLGGIGLTFGVVLGLLFCWVFETLQKVYPIMPEEVYRMSSFSTHLELQDMMWVILATLVICLLSSLAPAYRGANLPPVEGLKYE